MAMNYWHGQVAKTNSNADREITKDKFGANREVKTSLQYQTLAEL
jgi:hypothetical protein